MFSYLAQTDGGNDSQQWIAIAVGILGLAYLLLRPKLGRKKRDPLESMPRASLSQQRSLEREMNSLVVELSEMARQITAQLDTRAARLELLIKEADRKIAELDHLRQGGGDGYPSSSTPTPPQPDRDIPAAARPRKRARRAGPRRHR